MIGNRKKGAAGECGEGFTSLWQQPLLIILNSKKWGI
jgi:hypothetical protein